MSSQSRKLTGRKSGSLDTQARNHARRSEKALRINTLTVANRARMKSTRAQQMLKCVRVLFQQKVNRIQLFSLHLQLHLQLQMKRKRGARPSRAIPASIIPR